MKYKTIDDFDVRGKTVLLRSDLNSPVSKGVPQDNPRIEASSITINDLKKKGARVVVIAHQSRPGKSDFISLAGHARLLNKYCKVKFVADTIGDKAVREITGLKNGEAILLENVRFLKDEMKTKRNSKMIKVLSGACEIYINDAFSVSHRDQTSITGFAHLMESGIGRTMEYELSNLAKVKTKECLFILGGSKYAENSLLINKSKKVLACGVFGQICLILNGTNFGAQNKYLARDIKEIRKNKPGMKHVLFASDFAVNNNGRREEIKLEDFPSKYEIFDIGEETIARYVKEIGGAKAIFMKGTAGYCEEDQFCRGTYEILRAVANSKAHSVLAGGHTSSAAAKAGIDKKKFDYISLSGGALVKYLVDGKLIGLAVLKRK